MEPVLFVIAIAASQGHLDAAEQAARAYASQTGIDAKLDAYSRKLTTDAQRRHIGNAALLAQVCLERKISFKWSFR